MYLLTLSSYHLDFYILCVRYVFCNNNFVEQVCIPKEYSQALSSEWHQYSFDLNRLDSI